MTRLSAPLLLGALLLMLGCPSKKTGDEAKTAKTTAAKTAAAKTAAAKTSATAAAKTATPAELPTVRYYALPG